MTLDWGSLRQKIARDGVTLNCVAIAPTATISGIIGVVRASNPALATFRWGSIYLVNLRSSITTVA
jgi:hypothetical protein